MRTLKNIFLGVPNLPFILIIFYLIVNENCKNGYSLQTQMLDSEALARQVNEYLAKTEVVIIMYLVSIIFWLYILNRYILATA